MDPSLFFEQNHLVGIPQRKGKCKSGGEKQGSRPLSFAFVRSDDRDNKSAALNEEKTVENAPIFNLWLPAYAHAHKRTPHN
jgi:hypothetical protein